MELLIISSIAVLLFNIPFGYWRANVRKFSLQWVLAIHIPVPFIIALRLLTNLGFAWYTYVFMVTGFFFGQRFGAQIQKRMKRKSNENMSSCLFVEFVNQKRKAG